MEEQAAAFGTSVDRSKWRLVGLMHIAETREQAYKDVEYGIEQWSRYFQPVAAFPQMAVGETDTPRQTLARAAERRGLPGSHTLPAMNDAELTPGRAPRWFTGAIANRPTEAAVDVEGCPIHYLCWGDPAKPGLVLVHGGAAHAHWWSFIAPKLTHDYFVVAPDLSGHGDSGRRDFYRHETWAAEVLAITEAAGMSGCPIVVGHSMGGLVATVAAACCGDRLSGAVIVDSPISFPDPERQEGFRGRSFSNPKTYPDLATAIEHFYLIPPQPEPEPYILHFVARQSLRPTPDGGWTWKFDPRIFMESGGAIHEYLAQVQCRMAVLRGEFSDLVTPDVSEFMYETLGRNAPIVEIPEAYHHLLLDQPLAFIAALRALLADWDHSVPRSPPIGRQPGG
jgi:pimeloyl-ACP methyl ester carboxylesterase